MGLLKVSANTLSNMQERVCVGKPLRVEGTWGAEWGGLPRRKAKMGLGARPSVGADGPLPRGPVI